MDIKKDAQANFRPQGIQGRGAVPPTDSDKVLTSKNGSSVNTAPARNWVSAKKDLGQGAKNHVRERVGREAYPNIGSQRTQARAQIPVIRSAAPLATPAFEAVMQCALLGARQVRQRPFDKVAALEGQPQEALVELMHQHLQGLGPGERLRLYRNFMTETGTGIDTNLGRLKRFAEEAEEGTNQKKGYALIASILPRLREALTEEFKKDDFIEPDALDRWESSAPEHCVRALAGYAEASRALGLDQRAAEIDRRIAARLGKALPAGGLAGVTSPEGLRAYREQVRHSGFSESLLAQYGLPTLKAVGAAQLEWAQKDYASAWNRMVEEVTLAGSHAEGVRQAIGKFLAAMEDCFQKFELKHATNKGNNFKTPKDKSLGMQEFHRRMVMQFPLEARKTVPAVHNLLVTHLNANQAKRDTHGAGEQDRGVRFTLEFLQLVRQSRQAGAPASS